jgi:hypothetical protein
MCASGAVCRPIRVALARDFDESLAVEEEIDSLLAVASGEDDDPRPELVNAAYELIDRGIGRQASV